jgi:hypothetical protein
MKGYGLTVVKGDKIEKFGVEVIGVVPHSTPARSSILVRVSGLGLEESGIVAGMSGSPVFFDGKLAGAVASAWGFSKQPIGSVTPIESMLTIDSGDRPAGAPIPPPPDQRTPAKNATSFGASALLEDVVHALALNEDDRLGRLRELFASMVPSLPRGGDSLLAPTSAGFPAESLARFADQLSRVGLENVAQAPTITGGPPPEAANEPPKPLTYGSSITALLVDGDLRLGVTGTVTSVLDGGRFVGFGHPFLGFGDLELPVAEAKIVSVLPNMYQSFKIGYALKPAFRLTKDKDTGVAGRTDRSAPMIPVHFRLETDGGPTKTLTWAIAPHPKLLPILLALSADAALTVSDPTPRERTLRYKLSLTTQAGNIAYEDESTGARARDLALLTASTLAGAVAENEFEDPKLSSIDLSFVSAKGEKRLKLLSAALVSRKVAPGEDVVATLRLADRRGGDTTRVVKMRVPSEVPNGHATLLLSDGSTASTTRFALEPVEPRSLKDLGRFIGRLVPSDRLFAALIVPARGATTGSDTITSLPPTAAALLATGDPSDSLGSRLVAEEVQEVGSPLSGSIRLEFDVERPRS